MKALTRSRMAAAGTAVTVAVAAAVFAATSPSNADTLATSYTVTVGTVGTYSHPTDTSASTYIDKDGTFYFQQSASLYGSTQPPTGTSSPARTSTPRRDRARSATP